MSPRTESRIWRQSGWRHIVWRLPMAFFFVSKMWIGLCHRHVKFQYATCHGLRDIQQLSLFLGWPSYMQMSKCILYKSILEVYFDGTYFCSFAYKILILQVYLKYTWKECLEYTPSILQVYFKVYAKYSLSISLFRKGLSAAVAYCVPQESICHQTLHGIQV